MRPSPAPSSGGFGSARRGRRALAAGTALALSASLMGLTAPGAYAAPVDGDSWSTSFEGGDPQPLSSAPLAAAQNVNELVANSNVLVENVFGTDSNTGNEGAHRIIDPTGAANADKWFVGRKPTAENPIQAIYTLREPTTVTSYQIISGGDDKNRDPRAWNVYGSNEAGVGSNVSASSWELIDTVANQDFVRTGSNNTRYVSRWFDVDAPGEYSYYKIEFTDNWASSNQFQVGAWLLHTDTPRFDYSPHSKIESAVTTAPNANNRNERVHRLWDGNPGTKWRTETRNYARPTPTNPVYMMYTLEEATSFDSYLITSANDQRYPGQTGDQADPDDWTLFGTNDEAAAQSFLDHLPYDYTQNPDNGDWNSGTVPENWLTDWTVGAEWDEVDKVVDNGVFPLRRQQQVFGVDNPGAYKYVLMRIESSVQPNYMIQMSEFSLVNAIPGAVSGFSTNVVDGRAYKSSGSNVLRYSGKVEADGAASAANTLFEDLGVTVGSNTALIYNVQPTGEAGQNVLVDIEVTDENGSNAEFVSATAGIKTVNGVDFTTAGQGAVLTANQWNNVTVDLSAYAGKVVNRIVLRYGDDAATGDTAIGGLIRDIAVNDSPLAGDLALANAPQSVSIRANAPANVGLGVATGTGVIDPSSDLAATIDLNDGSTPIDLVTTATTTGAAISFAAETRIAVPATYSATVTVTLNGQSVTHDVTVVVVGDESVTSVFADVANMVCTTAIDPEDQNPDPNKRAVLAQADCDGNGRGYNRAALENPTDGVPFVFGEAGQFELEGDDFFFEVPDIPLDSPDAIIPSGQRWDVNVPEGATQIAFLGAGNEGTKSRTIDIVYADGTVEPVTVTFADWSAGSADPIVAAGNTVVTESIGRPHRNPSVQNHDNLPARIYSTPAHTLAVDGNDDPKVIDYIQMPPYEGQLRGSGYGQVRFFGFATELEPQAAVVAPQVAAEVVAEQTVTQAFTVDLATVTGGEAPFSATINWGDGSVLATGAIDDGVVSGTHTYAAAGTYSAVVTVTGNGASATAVVEIEVGRLASDIALSGPATAASNSGEVITATVTPTAATGQVQFSVAGQNIGDPVDLDNDNEATLDVSALSDGENTVTATYLGDALYGSASATHDIEVTKAASSITAGGGGDSFLALQTLPIHVTVTPAVEGRTVNVMLDGDVVVSGPTNAAGQVTLHVSPPVGTTSYDVVVVEDADYLGASAAPVVMTLHKHNVGVNLDPIATEPVEVGTSVNLRAVLPATATGEVQFKNGTENIGDPVSVNLGVALLQTSTLPAGTYSITAEYLGDDNHNGGVSAAQSLVIVKKTGSVSLAVPTADVLIGDDALVVATVPVDAAGSVTFVVNGNDQSPVNVADGQASLPLEDLAIGEYTVVAKFSGDVTYEAADSSAATFEVVKRVGSITLSTQTPSVEAGNEIVVEATLPAGAGGTVTFLVDGEVYGSPVDVADGTAEVTLSDLTIAEHAVTATYSGDARFTTATTSQALTITITKKSLSEDDFTIETPVGAVEIGSDDELTVELPSDANGSVSFTINGGTPILVPVEGGKASLPLADLPAGANEIVIVYSGDDNYAATAPQTVTITVAKLQSAVSLAGPIETIEEGAGVAVTATVNVGATGQVQFYVGGNAVGAPVNLIGNTASTTLNGLAAGRHTVTAKYLGDDTYESAQSADLVVVIVAKPGASVAVNAPVVSKGKQVFKAKPKKRVTITASVSGVTSGVVTFRSVKTGDVLGTAPITPSGSTYSASLRLKAKQAVGQYGRITASVGTVTSAQSARGLKVIKARPKKVTIRTKRVRAGASVKVKVKVAKLNNGRHANGRVQIRIGKRVIGSVRIKPKAKGNRTVTVKLSSAQRSGSSLKVRAKFVAKNNKSFKNRQSKVTTIRLVR